jgi:hypothetical protein
MRIFLVSILVGLLIGFSAWAYQMSACEGTPDICRCGGFLGIGCSLKENNCQEPAEPKCRGAFFSGCYCDCTLT